MNLYPVDITVRLILLLLALLLITGCGGGGASSSGSSQQFESATIRMEVSGQLPTGSAAIAGAYIELILPAGVTITGEPSNAITVNSQAPGKPQTAFVEYTPATSSSKARLSFFLLLNQPLASLNVLELPTVQITGASGTIFKSTDIDASRSFVINTYDAKIPGVEIVILS